MLQYISIVEKIKGTHKLGKQSYSHVIAKSFKDTGSEFNSMSKIVHTFSGLLSIEDVKTDKD